MKRSAGAELFPWIWIFSRGFSTQRRVRRSTAARSSGAPSPSSLDESSSRAIDSAPRGWTATRARPWCRRWPRRQRRPRRRAPPPRDRPSESEWSSKLFFRREAARRGRRSGRSRGDAAGREGFVADPAGREASSLTPATAARRSDSRLARRRRRGGRTRLASAATGCEWRPSPRRPRAPASSGWRPRGEPPRRFVFQPAPRSTRRPGAGGKKSQTRRRRVGQPRQRGGADPPLRARRRRPSFETSARARSSSMEAPVGRRTVAADGSIREDGRTTAPTAGPPRREEKNGCASAARAVILRAGSTASIARTRSSASAPMPSPPNASASRSGPRGTHASSLAATGQPRASSTDDWLDVVAPSAVAEDVRDLAEHVGARVPAEQRVPEVALADDAPRRPHVRGTRVAPPRRHNAVLVRRASLKHELLGRAVPSRAHVRPQRVVAVELARLAKVRELRDAGATRTFSGLTSR